MSRIYRAIKGVIAGKSQVETLIFDEVDSGISGATAAAVGERLEALSRFHQVICITHLPQIACQRGRHFLVKKHYIQGRMQTVIQELDKKGRIKEIARLLGDRDITRKAIERAKEMLLL